MLTRSATLRFALALLALSGQVAPLVASPVCASFGLGNAPKCALIACALRPIEQTSAGCCCGKPGEPAKGRSCCLAPEAPTKAGCCASKTGLAKTKTEPDTQAQLRAGHNCKCEKPTKAATSEPAVPPAAAPRVLFALANVPLTAPQSETAVGNPLPPPYPPPRAG